MNATLLLAARNGGVDPLWRWMKSIAPSGSMGWMTVTIVAILAVWIAVFLGERVRKRIGTAGPEASDLFRELCDAHQLSRSDREGLRNIAEAAQLARPAVIFLDPLVLERAAAGGGESSAVATALQRRLFRDTAALEF